MGSDIVGSRAAIQAILDQPGDASEDVKLSELVGGYYESSLGLSTDEAGGGGGVGLFQLTGKGEEVETKAVSPVFSVAYWGNHYKDAVARIGEAAFKADPEHAAEQAAYIAEAPKVDYLENYGPTKLDDAYHNAMAILGSDGDVGSIGSGDPTTTGNTDGTGGTDTSGGASGTPADWIGALDSALNPDIGGVSLNPLKDASDVGASLQLVAVRGGLAVVGLILIGAGLLIAFGPDIFGRRVVNVVESPPGGDKVADAAAETHEATTSDSGGDEE
jgi:hypothetical protein